MRIYKITLLLLAVFACVNFANAQCYDLGWDADPVFDPADPIPVGPGTTTMTVTFCNFGDELPLDPNGGEAMSFCPSQDYLMQVGPIQGSGAAFFDFIPFLGCEYGTQNAALPTGCYDFIINYQSIQNSDQGSNGNDPSTGLHCININNQPAGIHAGSTCFDPADDVVDACTWTLEIIIPVELTKFTAQKSGTNVDLDWATASEVNNSHFDVQRSSNGRKFETIGKVDGFGTTNAAQNYYFEDKLPLSGTNYYRLIQVDRDGTTTNTPVRSVSFDASKSVKIYPNPVVDFVMVESPQENSSLKVFNTAGKLVLSEAIDAGSAINTTGLSTGVYMFNVVDIHGATISSERVIVSK